VPAEVEAKAGTDGPAALLGAELEDPGLDDAELDGDELDGDPAGAADFGDEPPQPASSRPSNASGASQRAAAVLVIARSPTGFGRGLRSAADRLTARPEDRRRTG
jgi:hypothetical protein